MSKETKWVMPEWMEKYRELFNNTGGNSIEDLQNNTKVTIFENAPLAMICVAIHSQVALLSALHAQRLLK